MYLLGGLPRAEPQQLLQQNSEHTRRVKCITEVLQLLLPVFGLHVRGAISAEITYSFERRKLHLL
jgi:hypothetical protein